MACLVDRKCRHVNTHTFMLVLFAIKAFSEQFRFFFAAPPPRGRNLVRTILLSRCARRESLTTFVTFRWWIPPGFSATRFFRLCSRGRTRDHLVLPGPFVFPSSRPTSSAEKATPHVLSCVVLPNATRRTERLWASVGAEPRGCCERGRHSPAQTCAELRALAHLKMVACLSSV